MASRGVRVRQHFQSLDLGRRVAVRALLAFLVTFAFLRALTAIIHFEVFPHGPFRNLVTKSGLHIHHLFWGILLLMLTGFVALATRAPVPSRGSAIAASPGAAAPAVERTRPTNR